MGEKIGGDPFRIALRGEDDGFGRACGKIDGAIARDELFCGGNEAVAGAKDFVDARNGFCAVGEGSDGLCAADTGDRVMPSKFAATRSSGFGLGQTTVMR